MRRLQATIFKYITTMTTYSLTFPRKLHGTVTLPASKSLSARALIAGALAGESRLSGLSDCDDTRVLCRALKEADEVVDIMAAGTAMRFATAYFAATEGPCRILTGTERMKRRPIGILAEALRRLGASISYLQAEDYPPLRIEGRRLHGGEVKLPASVSSQYISALLLVAPAMTCGLTLHLEGTVMSRPYIDMTLGVMHHFGAKAGWRDGNTLHVEPGTYAPGVSFAVEPDWSAASYWYEMVALSPDPSAEILLHGLTEESLQGDSVVRHLFQRLGVGTEFVAGGARLFKQSVANSAPLHENLADCPDLAQTLVVTCAMLRRPFRFTGLQSLKIKETDRIEALRNELQKMGLTVEADDGAMWFAPTAGTPAAVAPQAPFRTYEDHRMAMSLAPCALLQKGVTIADPEVVSKSYPTFWNDLRAIGVEINV